MHTLWSALIAGGLLWTATACVEPTPSAPASQQDDPQRGGKADIFGENDRTDTVEHPNALLRQVARSSATLVNRYRLQRSSGGYRVSGRQRSLGEAYNLCQEEPFGEQPLLGRCSAWLAAPDLIVTNGHCMPDPVECEVTQVIFDYAVDQQGKAPDFLPADNVYQCKQVLAWDNSERCSIDYAIFQLDRPVVGREPVVVRQEGGPTQSDSLATIGYPFGLPQKIAGGGQLLRDEATSFRTTNDTIGGNSGSCLVNEATGVVEGLTMCSGANSLSLDEDRACYTERRCDEGGGTCYGASHTRTTLFADLLSGWQVQEASDYDDVAAGAQVTKAFQVAQPGRVKAVSVYAHLGSVGLEGTHEVDKLFQVFDITLRHGDKEVYVFQEFWGPVYPFAWYFDDDALTGEGHLMWTLPKDFDDVDAQGSWELVFHNTHGEHSMDVKRVRLAVAVAEDAPPPMDPRHTFSNQAPQDLETGGELLEDSLTVDQEGTVGAATLWMDLSDAPHSDVTVLLQSPSGTLVEVTSPQTAPSGLDLNQPITLEDFRGEAASGAWTLLMESQGDSGLLRNFEGWHLALEFVE